MNTQQNQVSAVCAWLSGTLKPLVDDPGSVNVEAVEGATTTILEVRVAPTDVPRVIGRKGRTADGIRALLGALGGKDGRRYFLEVVEPSHRREEIPGDAGLTVPVKVERRRGGDIRLSVEHGD